jgi:K+-sensing histidine kinase KdpD
VTKQTIDNDLTIEFILGRDGARLSFAGALALCFVACLGVAAVVASGFISGEVAFGGFLIAVVVISWWSAPGTAGVVAVVGFLFANGFAFDSAGALSWHGESDLLRLVTMVALALTVSVLGYGRLERSRHHVVNGELRKRVSS